MADADSVDCQCCVVACKQERILPTRLKASCNKVDVAHWYEITWRSAQGNVEGALWRVRAPLQELVDDMTGAARDLIYCCFVQADEIGFLRKQYGHPSSSWAGTFVRPVAASQEDEEMSEYSALCRHLCNEWALYKELAAIIILSSLLDPSGTAGVTLCSTAFNVRATQMILGVVSCIGAWTVWYRFDEDEDMDRTAQNRTALVLAISSGVHIFLSLQTDPLVLYNYFHFPGLAIQYLPDIVLNPALVSSLGFLSGLQASEVIFPMLCSSSLAVIGLVSGMKSALATPTFLSLCLGSATVILGCTCVCFSGFERKAMQLTATSGGRVKITGDLMVFGWSLIPMMHTLNIIGGMPTSMLLQMVPLTDIISKVAVGHMLTRSRFVLEAATLHAQARDRQPRENSEEPACEPPPNS